MAAILFRRSCVRFQSRMRLKLANHNTCRIYMYGISNTSVVEVWLKAGECVEVGKGRDLSYAMH